MKRIVIIIVSLLVNVILCKAGNSYGVTTELQIYNDGWEVLENGAGIRVVISEDMHVRIDSEVRQDFQLLTTSEVHYNSSNHAEILAQAIDQNGVSCDLRFVFRNDLDCGATLQIYIHYIDVSYVYNVKKTA